MLSPRKLVTIVVLAVFPILEAVQAGWNPIFEAFSGNGKSIYEAWSSGNETGHIQTNTNGSFHLRSALIDSWSNGKISKIKIELYRMECMVAWLIFDARWTTKYDWFSRERLVDSSFDDLKESKTFFQFRTGSSDGALFIITKDFGNCTDSFGWLIVLDKAGVCEYTKHAKYPTIMYTRMGTPRNLNTDTRHADRMIVYVRE